MLAFPLVLTTSIFCGSFVSLEQTQVPFVGALDDRYCRRFYVSHLVYD